VRAENSSVVLVVHPVFSWVAKATMWVAASRVAPLAGGSCKQADSVGGSIRLERAARTVAYLSGASMSPSARLSGDCAQDN